MSRNHKQLSNSLNIKFIEGVSTGGTAENIVLETENICVYFPYTRIIKLSLNIKNKSELSIDFGGEIVTLEGVNLDVLAHSLSIKKVRSIKVLSKEEINQLDERAKITETYVSDIIFEDELE